MCGIAGIVDRERSGAVLAEHAEVMADRIAHRGPDASGSWYENGIALSHRRLALLDLSNGAQPFHSSNGRYVIVYNGEVYNFRELRSELSGGFHTDCDTEVVLRAYQEWGPSCLKRFNGMFAFFIWDRFDKVGFAARDSLGVKPFLYTHEEGAFRFASEAKALIDSSPKIDTESILEYIVAPCFSGVETSPFKGVEILSPGHCMTITGSEIRTEQWCHMFGNDSYSVSPPDLREAMVNAVSSTMIADVAVGSYLSGGFDSTLITALAKPDRAFSVSFEDRELFDGDYSKVVISDDLPYARLAAREHDVALEVAEVSNDSLRRRLECISSQNDLLPAWEQEIAQDCLAEKASSYYKAVLVGDAADETHYGYHFLLDAKSPAEIIRRLSVAPIKQSLLDSPVEHFNERYEREFADLHTLIRKRWLPRLLHNGDIHSMAYGLESRVPFADRNLLKLAKQVSPKHGMHKRHLRECSKGLMPESIRVRKKSALPKAPTGWQVYHKILSNEFLDVAETWLDMDILQNLLRKEHFTEQEQSLFFRLCCLGFWTERYKVSLS